MTHRRSRLRLEPFIVPAWKRAGLWQGAALAAALVPAIAALALRFAPIPEPSPSGDARSADKPALRALVREPIRDDVTARIASANLFASSREDWPLAPALAEGKTGEASPSDVDRLKAAQEALDRATVVAVLRINADTIALLDPGDRKPGEDLVTLKTGDDHRGWKVEAISRDVVDVRFEETKRSLRVGPKPAPKIEPTEKTGRSRVEMKEVAGVSKPLVIPPPITLAEMERRLHDATPAQERKIREMIDQLLEQLEKERGGRGVAPPPEPRPPSPR